MAASGHRLTGIYRGHPLSLHVTLYIGHLRVLASLAQKSPCSYSKAGATVVCRFDLCPSLCLIWGLPVVSCCVYRAGCAEKHPKIVFCLCLLSCRHMKPGL